MLVRKAIEIFVPYDEQNINAIPQSMYEFENDIGNFDSGETSNEELKKLIYEFEIKGIEPTPENIKHHLIQRRDWKRMKTDIEYLINRIEQHYIYIFKKYHTEPTLFICDEQINFFLGRHLYAIRNNYMSIDNVGFLQTVKGIPVEIIRSNEKHPPFQWCLT
jgi:hypothetical protein